MSECILHTACRYTLGSGARRAPLLSERCGFVMLRRLVIVVLIVLAGFATASPASAVNFVGGSVQLTCTNASLFLSYNTNRDNTGTGLEHYAYVVSDGNGTVLLTVMFVDTFSGTDDLLSIPYSVVPSANPISVRFFSFAGNGYAEETYYTATYSCPGLPDAGFQGPGIPSGFQLHTITCDVAVFATPGGAPVTNGARIRAGQTWFVNPTPVDGADGQSWTEIFVSGYTNGYVPTTCVGG